MVERMRIFGRFVVKSAADGTRLVARWSRELTEYQI
jgi:hypothetical protein